MIDTESAATQPRLAGLRLVTRYDCATAENRLGT